uniref:Uncharacterized protein LOC108039099 n=1 Tax=Drosophila rhopaloa TaxID=1041015 RepID=A0A6P4E0W1_DRORH
MPIGKLKMPTRSEVVGEDSANVPKMELLKVNYVYQCKNAIMHRSNESPLPARENNATCFGGYRHQLGKLSQTSHSHQTGRSLSPSSFRTPLAYLKPPIVDSWELLLQPTQKRGLKPILKPEETKMINFTLSQTDSHSAEFFKNLNTFSMDSRPNIDDFKNSQSSTNQSHPLTAVSGIKSRADRIARIENRECNFHIKPDSRIAKHSSVPEWMFKNAGTGDDSGLSKCSNNVSAEPPEQYFRLQHKAKLKHVQKKRQPLLMTDRLRHKKERPTKPSGLPQTNYCDESYDYKLCSMPQSEEGQNKANCKDKRVSVKSCSDSGVSLSKDCSQKSKTIYNGKRANFENIEKHGLAKKFEELNGSIQIKPHGDPNDLQNFSKKDLNKATTNELLIAAAENTKKCNIEMERRLNNLKVRGKEPTFDECWDRETGSPYDDYEKGNIPLSPTPKISSFVKPYNKNSELVFTNGNLSELSELSKSSRSTTSLSLSGCSKCYLDNSSVCSSEEDCCECNDQKYSTTPIDYLSNDCYNAIEGVFWNNAYDDIPPVDITPSCCCSLSCCDEDDCSFFDGNLCVEIKSVPAHQPEDCGAAEYLTRNKMIPLKKYAENDSRLRSNDDTNLPASKSISPVPKTSEQIQNQVIDVLKVEADKN